MDNVEEIDKFLEKYKFPKLNQEEIENHNRPALAGGFFTPEPPSTHPANC